MTRLFFCANDVRRVVEHSINAPAQSEQLIDYNDDGPVTAPVKASAVILVHDQGVYLMSNGKPRDIIEGELSFVAYARGCNPNHDPEWWDNARLLVGGDDFGETLPFAAELKALIDSGARRIMIEITDESISIGEAK